MSGAVQDHDRGIIVGRRTFGKGLVQRPVELPDGSMIRLTVSHYYTPSGRCIQKPYVKGEKEKYNEDLNTRFTHGELMHLDSIHLDSTKVYTTLEKHRTALRFTDSNRKAILRRYKSFDDYLSSYAIPTSLLDDIEKEAEKKGIKPKDEAERKEAREDMAFMLKALVAYNVWDRNEYFRIINQKNDIVKRALEELQKP